MDSTVQKNTGKQASALIFLMWFGLGLMTSFPGLTAKTLFYDEIFETRMALLPVADQVLQYANPAELHRTSPPLYHIFLHPVLASLGVTPFTVRSISWVSGAISVALMYFLLQEILPRPWPLYGTLGFMLSAWHITLAQTARQHSLFFMFVLLSLLLGINFQKTGKRFVWYALSLVAASHTYYWGIVAVLPSHVVATLLMRRKLVYWRRVFIAQFVAVMTAIPHFLPIFHSYQLLGHGNSSWSVMAIPYFCGILVEFSSATWSQLELGYLPWVAILSAIALFAIISGIFHWRQEQGLSVRWLGLCCLIWWPILFLGYSMGAATLLGAPLARRFAILQIPLLVAFLYGISHIYRSAPRYGVFLAWAITTAMFGIRVMNSDLYKGSQLIADQIAQLPTPITTFLNFDTSLPAEQGSLAFLLERMGASKGHEFRYFDFRSAAYPENLESSNMCFSYMHEGGYLRSRLAKIMPISTWGSLSDTELNNAMQTIVLRFQKSGWRTLVNKSYPGRISYQLACFQRHGTISEIRSP